jgi:hypothetical protein
MQTQMQGTSILIYGKTTELYPAGSPECLARVQQLRAKGHNPRVVDVYPKDRPLQAVPPSTKSPANTPCSKSSSKT